MTAATNKAAQEPLTIAVIGGGIGGISLSIGLLHRGINVQIYEAAPAFKEIGAGVTLGPNSIRAMHLIDPAIKAAFDRLATKNHAEEEAETWMNVRRGIGEGDLVLKINTTDAEKTGLSSVHRTQFLNELVKLIPHSAANLGRRLVNLHPGAGPNGKVRLEFEDGGVAEADAVIGCDGVRSRVRQILLGKESEIQDLNFSGKYAYRGLVPMKKAQRVLGDYFARNCHMYIGPGSYVFHYPIDHGRLVNVIAVKTKENGKWEHERWVQSATTEEVKEAFRPWRTSVRNILAQLESPTIWALFDHSPAPSYFNGLVAILGDAAHASTPHQGAGAGQALEDAFILSNLLGDPLVRVVADIPAAFKAYDAVRRPRSQKVVVTSREAGKVFCCEGEGVGDNTEKIRENLSHRQKWIWEVDHKEQLKKARAILEEEISRPEKQKQVKISA